MYMNALAVYMSIHHMHTLCSQKSEDGLRSPRAFQMVVSRLVDGGNQPQVLWVALNFWVATPLGDGQPVFLKQSCLQAPTFLSFAENFLVQVLIVWIGGFNAAYLIICKKKK